MNLLDLRILSHVTHDPWIGAALQIFLGFLIGIISAGFGVGGGFFLPRGSMASTGCQRRKR